MSNQGKSRAKIVWLTRLGLLLAIVVILTVFNIGNIPIGPVVATVYQVPVIVGAVLLGPGAGCILGGAWGLLNFYLALTGQTTDIVALAVIQQSPALYFVISFVPRLLTGLLSGLTYMGMTGLMKSRRNLIPYAVTGALGSLYNTIFYLGALYLLIRELLASLFGIELGAVGAMVLGVAVTNGLIEAGLCAVIVTAVCRALYRTGAAKQGE